MLKVSCIFCLLLSFFAAEPSADWSDGVRRLLVIESRPVLLDSGVFNSAAGTFELETLREELDRSALFMNDESVAFLGSGALDDILLDLFFMASSFVETLAFLPSCSIYMEPFISSS